MSSTRPRTFARSLAALALAAAVVGCSGEEPLVDRVQTNLVDKAIFEGEWWYSSATIDVDFDEAEVFGSADAFAPFEGSLSVDYALDYNRGGTYVLSPSHSLPIARIRWVVDEKFLFAYRSYELTDGAEPDGDAPDFRGQPLAAFAIEGHVDVRREYNPATGEETNVRYEDGADRRWYERAFMRVDWSQNLLTDFAANEADANALFTSFRHEPTSLFVDEGEPGYPESWRPRFIRVGDDPDYRMRGEWGESDEDTIHTMSFVSQEVWSPGSNCLIVGGTCASALVTLRHSFLRVPPEHEYAARTLPHSEFDRFGIIRSAQPTYVTGGADRAELRIHCFDDADCGSGGACDTGEHICVGGLTEDRGETDFLTFYMSLHNFHSDSLTDTTCVSDWECDGRYLVCDEAEDVAGCEKVLRAQHGSVCDPAARRCTIALREREDAVRAVVYHLSPGFPPHLVRQAYEAVASWNESLMRSHRAALGQLPLEQRSCSEGEERDFESDSQVVGDGKCTADLTREALVACQQDNPAAYCWCGSPEESRGRCALRYDPFETPDAARERGVPNPYDCWVEGPPDPAHPVAYEDYDPAEAYGYAFRGDDCLLVLRPNSCDVDADAPCEELGDLRYQFLTHIQHGAVAFGGVAQPLSDPTNGELVVSYASIAAESIESVGTIASQFFPVLRGEVPEDEYFDGEHVRGYFARLGRVEHPVSLAPSGTDGYSVADPSRPPTSIADSTTPDAFAALAERFQERLPQVERLRGQEGRAAILSDRLHELAQSPLAARVRATLGADESPEASASGTPSGEPISFADEGPLAEALRERERRGIMAARFRDDFSHSLFNSQYWRYWAEAFAGVPAAEAAIRLQQAYARGVIAHEVGHALGLEHNFAASLDRDQYPDTYFQLARDVPLPAYLDYDAAGLGGNEDGDVTREEASRWAEELRVAREERLVRGAGNVMSSSVMDYHGDLSDFAGLGRYDAAAVGFAYFDRVEAYALADVHGRIDWDQLAADGLDVDALREQGARVDPENPTNLADGPASLVGLAYSDSYPRELWTYYRGGERCVVDSQCPHAAGRETTIYQPVTQRCVTNPRYGAIAACQGRAGCLCSNFDDDFRAYAAGQAYGATTAARDYAPVEYRFCDGTRTSDISWCTQFDAGESFQEVVEHYRRGWLERYPQAYFRNFRRSLPERGASWGSVAEAVKIYQHLFFRSNFEGAAYNADQGPLGFYDQLYASADVLNWLMEIIGAPDVGSYALDADANLYRKIADDPGAPGSDLDLGVGHGFYLWSQYQEGLNGFFRLERAGTFLDKILAIEALTRRDWGLGYTIDERYYVNFYDVFDREVLDLFGGLVLRNPAAYAPRVVAPGGEPSLRYLSAFRGFFAPPGDNNAATFPEPAVDGTDTEVLRDAAAIQALAEFPVYYDTSFEQRLLVFKLGSGDGYDIPATRTDGSPTCGWGDAGCDVPDFIRYDSDRLHTTYVAVVINPDLEATIDERQLGFELLKKLQQTQDRIHVLEADPDRDAQADAELERLRLDLERDESFVEYLIELAREFGISSWIR